MPKPKAFFCTRPELLGLGLTGNTAEMPKLTYLAASSGGVCSPYPQPPRTDDTHWDGYLMGDGEETRDVGRSETSSTIRDFEILRVAPVPPIKGCRLVNQSLCWHSDRQSYYIQPPDTPETWSNLVQQGFDRQEGAQNRRTSQGRLLITELLCKAFEFHHGQEMSSPSSPILTRSPPCRGTSCSK